MYRNLRKTCFTNITPFSSLHIFHTIGFKIPLMYIRSIHQKDYKIVPRYKED